MLARSLTTIGAALAFVCVAATPAIAGPNDYASAYDPATNTTTTVMRGPGGGFVRKVEVGNTLRQQPEPPPRLPAAGRMFGQMYDPETNTTTTLIRTPRGQIKAVAPGNAMGR